MSAARRLLAAAGSLLLAAVGAVALGAPAAASPPPVHLRVVSYNIHAGAGADHQFDLDRTTAAIRALDADIVGLQEVDVHWGARSQWRNLAAELGDRLDMHVGFAPIYSLDPPSEGAPRREFGVAVLSRYPIVAFENHEITRLSTQDPNPAPRPAPGFGEAVIQARGATVHTYVTHLDYRPDPSVRAAQVRDTLRIMRQDGRSATQLLLGDFNAEADAPELEPLWSRVVDGYVAAGGEPPGDTYPATDPTVRLDYVTGSRDVTPLDASVPATLASDHLPVVVDVAVPRGRP